MPWTVTRQSQWPSGEKMVEVSAGGPDYSNPDALVCRYGGLGERETFDSPVEAVEAAIRICQAWRQDGAPDAQVGYGATYGMTLPFDASTFDEARTWARERLANLPRCDRCGELLPERHWTTSELMDESLCSENCAERAYEESQVDLAELE